MGFYLCCLARNALGGIEKPQDLVDKRIGELALFGHDAGVQRALFRGLFF